MPSSKKARQAIIDLVETAGGGAIVDLGSGWGSLIIRLAMKYPDREVVGYELSFIPWLATVLMAKLLGLNNMTVHRQDFLLVDLSAASVIVCYLFPAGMAALEAKLAVPTMAVHYVISNNFSLPSYKAEKTVILDDFYRSPVYCYRIS